MKMGPVKEQRRQSTKGKKKEARNKDTEPKGKILQEQPGVRHEWRRDTERINQREERKKVIPGDGKCSGEGVFMSGCRRRSGAPFKREFDRESERGPSCCCLKDG